MKSKRILVGCFFLIACLAAADAPKGAPPASSLRSAAWQCRTADKVVTKQIRFARGRTTSVVKDSVPLCTAHEYHLRARAGQTMNVNLATGRQTSLTIYAPDSSMLVDGEKSWSGELPATGLYIIHIGTDATARYTLEVNIR